MADRASSNSSKGFFTKDNMQLIVNIFQDYMKDKHGLIFHTIEEVDRLKKQIFAVMNEVSQSASKTSTVHELNIAVLASIRSMYNKQSQSSKPNVKQLDRDQQVFGNREINVNELIPQGNPYSKRALPSLDELKSQREDKKETPDISKLGRQIKENADTTDDFMKKLAFLESERNHVEQNLRQTIQPPTQITQPMERLFMDLEAIQDPEQIDPKKMYQAHQDAYDRGNDCLDGSNKEDKEKKIGTLRESLLIPRDPSSQVIGLSRYISINSFDREWTASPLRYQYVVSFGNEFQRQYKNIRSMEVGKVIIPEEIIENINILNYPNKTNFNYEFSFSYPYLLLRVEEFNDVYDGTNDAVRKSFCKLVYHRSYKAPNGRGYVILKPIQKEKKAFYPTPLSTLNKLTLSLLKPNGQLLNQSSDSYKIFKVDYEPFNPHYLNIVTDVFYDKNEFFVGDTVVLQGFSIPNNTAGTTASQIKELVDFINRPEGHEVVQIGSTNDNGFYRSFYIVAPGAFNKQQGRFDVRSDLTTCLDNYNNTINYAITTATNGYIMNFSLQNSIGLSLEVAVNDSSIKSSLV